MSRRQFKSAGQSGSAGRHFMVLLALAVICYFGVKAFYGRIDSALNGSLDRPQQGPAGAAIETSRDGAGLSQIDKEAITRRNLFLPPSGQQGGAGPGEALPGAAAEPDLLLVGTIVEAGGRNRAVILDVEGKKQVMLSEGEMINGVSIRQIDSGKVVISRQGRNEMLDIAETIKIQAAARATVPGAAGGPTLGRAPARPDSSLEEVDESEDDPLRVDLNRLDGVHQGIIVKGRVSENI
jgi:hypothetical protein